jgi:hypothetical protein
LLQRPGRKDTEGHIARFGARELDQFEIAVGVDLRADQHLPQSKIRSFRGGEAQTFDGAEIAAPGGKVGPDHKQPGRPLRQGDHQLGAAPAGKLSQNVVH